MKKQLLKSIFLVSLALVWSRSTNAQALFKDLEPGSNVSSNPQQFTNVNGIVYFITDPSSNRKHALWKTDGTVGNTVMVKDSIIVTSVTDRFMIRGYTGDTLFYTVNINVQTDTTTELWMVTNSTAPVLVTMLTSRNVNAFSNGEPRQYTIAGGKLYFQMYTDHGYELWVSDGTALGTHEVVDLFPGSTSGIANGGTNNVPMAEYKGKIYFQGITSFSGPIGLYSSNGTAGDTTLLKAGLNLDPQFFTVYHDTLYFQVTVAGNDELWKTDGTVAGTVKVANTGFNSDVRIFKNYMYYNVASTMYKSDGTTSGTVPFKDSVGVITGMNNDYFLARYIRSLPTPPYYEYYYWRSDGTPGGTVRVADSLINASSFAVLNNKMYSGGLGNALWESDGTGPGTRKLLSGVVSYPFILNNTVFFSNFGSGTGYELWSYTPTLVGLLKSQAEKTGMHIYPNPSNGYFQLIIDNIQSAKTTVEIYNISGAKVYTRTIVKEQNEIDISGLSNGIYLVKALNGTNIYSQKIIVQQ